MPRLRSNIVAVYVVRPSAEGIQLLMLQRPPSHRFANQWQTVGGHIEEKEGEAAWQAAMRELDEETGLSVERWYRIDRPETFYNPENDTIYMVPAFAAVVLEGAEPTLSEEHQAWRWLTPEEAAGLAEWAAMQESLRLVGAALSEGGAGMGLSAMDPVVLSQRD